MNRISLLGAAVVVVAILAVPAFAADGGTVNAAAAPAGGSSATACNPGGKDVVIGGKPASVFCGPASATVKLGGRTLTFRNGTCIWKSSTFTLELGTIFLFWGKPYPLQPGFAIRAAGYPVARALVEIYSQGKRTSLSTVRATARPNASRTGGTFEGRTAAGARVIGTVKCG
jgi:hypothetical protein